jgi:geranylgeranyl diphosphate synthase type II
MTAAATPAKIAALSAFGRALGLAFQIIDDILDVTQTTAKLGKTAGKDKAAAKATYPALIGLAASRREAGKLTAAALAALVPFRTKGERLRQLAELLLKREY